MAEELFESGLQDWGLNSRMRVRMSNFDHITSQIDFLSNYIWQIILVLFLFQ